MDISQLLQYSMLTKVFSEQTITEYFSPYQIAFLIAVYFIIKNIPLQLYVSLEDYIITLFDNKDECSMIIPFHNKTYVYGTLRVTKTMYSERFLAINHYIKQNKTDISSLIEQMNFEAERYYGEMSSEYILLPSYNQRIQICNKDNIYLEMIIDIDRNIEKGDEKNVKNNYRQYTYKITKRGKDNLYVLKGFLEMCEKMYDNDTNQEDFQKIFEFDRSKKDDNDIVSLVFKEHDFHTNKSFSNIFIENKDEILEEIREFSKNIPKAVKEKIKARYEYNGTPYKRTYLLHGPPGCGKSSLIKAFIKETGRHCMMIPWSRIKTSADFASICRVQYKKLTSKDVIIVFEDFDANTSNIVKVRENLACENLAREPKEEDIIKKTIEKTIEKTIMSKEDELNLECVLNTLDGIHELHDSIIIFTTNDIISMDPALLREGRIDKIIHMDLANTNTIRQMIKHYYTPLITDIDIDIDKELDRIKDIKMAPSKVQSICIRNKNIVDCVNEMKLTI